MYNLNINFRYMGVKNAPYQYFFRGWNPFFEFFVLFPGVIFDVNRPIFSNYKAFLFFNL